MKEQFKIDIESRIKELEDTLYSAEKHRADFSRPANTWGGAFSTLNDKIRYFDVPEYVEYLKNKLLTFHNIPDTLHLNNKKELKNI